MDISSYRAQMVVSPWWTGIFGYLHPVFLWSLIWGQSSIISKLYRNIKTGFDPRCRKRELLLSWIEHVTGHKVVDLNSVWKDGRILCDIIQDSCPETDMSWDHFSGHTFHRGQTLITRCLQIQPAFCESDFARKDLTPELEKRLFRYLSTIRQALNRRQAATSLSLDDDSDAEPQVADEYIARGMGLLMASRNRRAIFYIYSRDGSSLYNIRIEIQGPEGDHGLAIVTPETQISTTTVTTIPIDYRLTTDYLRVSYQPRNLGNHELSITRYGYFIPGSPFHICVDDTTNRPGKRYASIDWLTIDEEEEIRKKEEIKKKGKVKCRIVDFVTEQMYLTDDGKLVKILPNTPTSVKSNTPLNKSQKYLTAHEQGHSRSRSRSISPRRNKQKEKQIYNSLTYKAVKKLLSMTPVKKIVQVTDASAQVQIAEYKTTSVVFKEKCKKIVNTCDFLLKNLPKQTSLDILNNATRILQSPTRDEFKQFPIIDSEELESIITEIKSTAESELKSTETELTSTAMPKLSVTIKSIDSDNDDVFLPDVHQYSNKTITSSARFLSSNIYDGLNDISEIISETNTDNPNRLLSDNSLTTEEVQHSSRRSSVSEARLSFKQEGNTKLPNRRLSFSAINRSVSQEYLKQQSKFEDDDILTITDNVIDITGTKDYQTLNKSENILEVKQDDLKDKSVEIDCKNEYILEVKQEDLKDKSVEIISKNEHFVIKQDDLKDKSVETDCKNEHKLEIKQDESKIKVKGKLVCKIIEQFETHMSSNECSKNDKVINFEDVEKHKVDSTIKNRKTNQYYSVLNSTNFIDNTKENQTENNKINHYADIFVKNKISDTVFKELITENNSKQDKNINYILKEEVKQSQTSLDIFKIDHTNHVKINKDDLEDDNKEASKMQLKESECTESTIAKTNLLNVNNTDVFLNNAICDIDFNEMKLTEKVEITDNVILKEEINENYTYSEHFKTDKTNHEINKYDIDNVIKDDTKKTQLKEKKYTNSNIGNNDKKALLVKVNKEEDNLCQTTTPIRDVSPENKKTETKMTNRTDKKFEISEKVTTPTKDVKGKVNTTQVKENIKKICSLFESNFMYNEKDLNSEEKEKISEIVEEKTKSQSGMQILKRPSDFQPRLSLMKTGVEKGELEPKEIEPIVGQIKIKKYVFESQLSPSKSEIHSFSGCEQLKEPLEVWEINSHLCETVSEITETSKNKNTDIKLFTIVDLCNDEYKPNMKFVKTLPFEEFKCNYGTSLNKSYNQTKLTSSSPSSRDEKVYRAEPQIVRKMIQSEPEIIGEIFRAEPAVVEELFRAEPALVEEFCRMESVEVQEIIGAESSVIRDFTNRMCSFVSRNKRYKKYLDSMKGIEDKVYHENKTIFETNQTLMNEIEMLRENCEETNNLKHEYVEPFLKNEFKEIKNTDLTIQESKEIKTIDFLKTKPTTNSKLGKADYKRPKVMCRSSSSTKTKIIDIGEVNKFENTQYQNPTLYTKLLSDGELNFSKENVEIKTEQSENKRSNMLIPKTPDKSIGVRIMPRGWMQENNHISKDRTQTEFLLSKDTQGNIIHEQYKQVETIVTEDADVCIEEPTSCETEKIHTLKINDIDINLNVKETEKDKKGNTLDCIFDDREEENYTNVCNIVISNDILTFDTAKESKAFDNTKEIVIELSKEDESIIPTIETDIITNTANVIVNDDSKVGEYKIADIKNDITKDKMETIDFEISKSGEMIIADAKSETVITETSVTEDSEVIISDNEGDNKTNTMEVVFSEDSKEMKPFIGNVKSEILTGDTKAVVNENDKDSMPIISIFNSEKIIDITKSFVSDDSKESEEIIAKGKNDIIADNTNAAVTEHGAENESIIAYAEDTIAGFTNDIAGEDSKINKPIIADVESKNKTYTKEAVFDRESKEHYIVEITADKIVRKESIDCSRPIDDAKVKITADIKIAIIAEDEKGKNAMTIDVNDKITTVVFEDAIEEKDKIENVEDIIISGITDDNVAGGFIEKIPNTVVNEREITRDLIINEIKENESIIGEVEVEVKELQSITADAECEITKDHVPEIIITENKPISPVIENELTAIKSKQEDTEKGKITADINRKIKTKHVVAEITEIKPIVADVKSDITAYHVPEEINESTTYIESKIKTINDIVENIMVDVTEVIVPEDSKEVEPTITEITEDIMVNITETSVAEDRKEVESTVAKTTDDIVIEITESSASEDGKEVEPTVTEITKNIMVDIIKPSLAEVEPTVTATTNSIVIEITESSVAEDSKEVEPTVTEITKNIMVDIIKPSLAEVEPTLTKTTDDIVIEITESSASEDSKEVEPTVTEITKDIMVDIIKPSLAEVEPTLTETTDDIVVEITESRASEDRKEVEPTFTEITKDIIADIIKPSLVEVEPTVTETTGGIVVEITESSTSEDSKEVEPTVTEITNNIMVDIIKPSLAEVEPTVTETTDGVVIENTESSVAEDSKEVEPTVTEVTKDIMVDITKPSLAEVEPTVTETTDSIVVEITESSTSEDSKEVEPTVTEITKNIMVDIIKPSLAEVEPTVTETTDDIVVEITESSTSEGSKDVGPTVTEITKDIMVDIIKPSLAEVEPTVTETTDNIVIEITESSASEDSKEVEPTVTEITKDIMVDIIKPILADVEPTVTETTDDIVVEITESSASEDRKEVEPTFTEITKDIMAGIIKPSLVEVEPTVTETTDGIVVEITESRTSEDRKKVEPTVTEITKDIMVDIIKPSLAEVEPTVTKATNDIVVEITESSTSEDRKEVEPTVTEITKDIMVDIIKPSLAEVEPTVTETADGIVVDITESSTSEDRKEVEPTVTEITKDIMVDIIKPSLAEVEPTVTETTDDIVIEITESSASEDRKEVEPTVTEITKDIMADIIKPSLVEVEPTVTETTDGIVVEITESSTSEDSKEVEPTVTEITNNIMVDIIKPSLAEVEPTVTETADGIVVDITESSTSEDSKEVEPTVTETTDDIVVEITESSTSEDSKEVEPTVTEITNNIMVDIIKPSLAEVEPTVTETADGIVVDITESSTSEDSKEVEPTVTETTDDIVVEITESSTSEDSKEVEPTVTEITNNIMVDIIKPSLAEVEPTVTETADGIVVDITESSTSEDSKEVEPTVTEITKDIMVNISETSVAEAKPTIPGTAKDIIEPIVAENSKEMEPTITEDNMTNITESIVAADGKRGKHIFTEISEDVIVDTIKATIGKEKKDHKYNSAQIKEGIMVDINEPTVAEDGTDVKPINTEDLQKITVDITGPILAENSTGVQSSNTEVTQDIMLDINEPIITEEHKEFKSIITEISEDNLVNTIESILSEESKYIEHITKITEDIMLNMNQHIVVEDTEEIEPIIEIQEDKILDITKAIVTKDNKEVEPTITEIMKDNMVDIIEAIIEKYSKDDEPIIIEITQDVMEDNTKVNIAEDSKKIKEVKTNITEITEDNIVDITKSIIAVHSKEGEPNINEIINDFMADTTEPIAAKDGKEVGPTTTEIAENIVLGNNEHIAVENSKEIEPAITEIVQDVKENITECIVAEDSKDVESMITKIKEVNTVDIIEAIISADNKKIKYAEPTITEITQDIMVDITELIVTEDSKEIKFKIREENILDNTEVIIEEDSKKIKKVEPTINEITQDVLVNIIEPVVSEDSKEDEPTATEILEDIMLHITEPILLENSKGDELTITLISQDIMIDISELIVEKDSKVVESNINEVTQDVMEGSTEPIVAKHNTEVQPTTIEFVENILGDIAKESLIKESKEAEDAITESAADILVDITQTFVADIRGKIVVEDNIKFEPTITETVAEYSIEEEPTISDIANEIYFLEETTKIVENTISEIEVDYIVEDSKEIEPSIFEIEGLIVAEDSKDVHHTIKDIAEDCMVDFNEPVREMLSDITETIIENNKQVELTITKIAREIVVEDNNEVEPIITEIVTNGRQVVETNDTKIAEKIGARNSKEVTEKIVETIIENFVAEHSAEVEPSVTEIAGGNLTYTIKTNVPDDSKTVEPTISENIMVDITEASIVKVSKEVETDIYEIVRNITEENVGQKSNEIEPILSVITKDIIVDIHETIVTEDRKKDEHTITKITENIIVDIAETIMEEVSKEAEPPITEILEDIMVDSTETIIEEDSKEVEQPITETVEGIMDIAETIVKEDNKEVELPITEITEDIMVDSAEKIVEGTSKEDELTINEITEVIMINNAETIVEEDNKQVEYPITEIVEGVMLDIPETIVEKGNEEIEFPIPKIEEDIMADNAETIMEEGELQITKITKDTMVYITETIVEKDGKEIELPITEITEDIMADSAETIVQKDRKGVYHKITNITEDIMVDIAEKNLECNKEVEFPITQIAEDIIVDFAETIVVEHNKGVEHPISEIAEDLIVDIAETMLEGERKDVELPITAIVEDFMVDITETIVANNSKEFYTTIADSESEITTGISNILFTKDNKEDELICYVDEENISGNTNTFPAQYIKEDELIFPDSKVEVITDCIADKQNKDIEIMPPISELNITDKTAMNDIVEMIAVTATDHVKTGSIEDGTKVQAICVLSDSETINVENTKEQTIVAETELDFVGDTDERQIPIAIDDIRGGGMMKVLGKPNFAKTSNAATMQIKGAYTNVTSDEQQEMVVDVFNLEEKHIKEKKRKEQAIIPKQTDILKFENKKKQLDSPSVKSKINSFNVLLKEKEVDNCSYSLTNSKLIKTFSKEKTIQTTNSNTNLQEKNICAGKGFLFSETKRDFEPQKLNDLNPSFNSKLFPKDKEKILINDRIKHFENIVPSALSHTSLSLSHSQKQDQNNSVKNRIAEFGNTVLVDNLIKGEFNKITKTNEKHISKQNEKQELFIFGGKEYEYEIESETTYKEDNCDTPLDWEIKFNVDTVVSDEKIYLEQQNNITTTGYKPKTQHDLNIDKSKESETYLKDISDVTTNTILKSKINLDVTKIFKDKSHINNYNENKIISNSELSSDMVLNTETHDIEDTENITVSNLEYKNDITEMKHNKILDTEVSEYIKETKMKNLKLIGDMISNNEKKNDTIIDEEYGEYNEETTVEDLEYIGKKVPVSDRVLDSENIYQVTTTIGVTENEAINVELIGDILKIECENDQVLEDTIENITNKQTEIPFNLEAIENISIVEDESDTKLDVNTLFYETNVEECNESSESCTLLQGNEIIYATNTIYNEINVSEYNMNETMMNPEEKMSIFEIKNKSDRILQDDEVVQEKKIVGEKNTTEQNEKDFVESKIDDTNFNLEPLICTLENEHNKILGIDEIQEKKIDYVGNIEDDHNIVISETSNIENQSNTVTDMEQYKTDFFENHEDILTLESSMPEFKNEYDTIDKDKIAQENTDISEDYESLLNAESINNVCIVEQKIKSEVKLIFVECESVILKEMFDEVQQERDTTFFENILQDVTHIHQSIQNETMYTESNEAMIQINEIENEFEKILDENEIDSEKINIDKIIEDETMLTLEINEISTVDEEFNTILAVNSLQPVKGNIEDVNDHELKKIKGNILFDDENKYNDSEKEVNNFNDNNVEEYKTDPCIFSPSSFKVVSTNEDNMKTIDDITDEKTDDILVDNNLQTDNSTTQGIPMDDSIVYSTTGVVKNTNEELQQLNSILLNNDVFKNTSETNISDMSDKTDKENKLLKDEFDIDLQIVKKNDLSQIVLKDIDVYISEPLNDNILSIDSQERNINDIYNILEDENELLSTVQECEKAMSIGEPYTNEVRQSVEKLDLGVEIISIKINDQNTNLDSGSGTDIINVCDMLQINNENYDETVICRNQSIDEMPDLTNNEKTNLQELEFRTDNESDVQMRNVDLLRDWEDPFEEIQNDKMVNEQLKETIKDINDYDILNKNLLSVEQELTDVINIEDEELDEEIQNEIAKLYSTVEVTSDDINRIDIQEESLLQAKDVNIEDEELDLKTQEELVKVDSIEIGEDIKEIDKCRKQFLMKSLRDHGETIEDEELDIDTQAEITKVEKIVLNENDKLMNRNLEHKSSIVDKYITEETFEDVLIDEDEMKFDDDINKTDDKELENLHSLNDVHNTKPNLENTNKMISIQKLNHETIVTDLQTGVTFPDMNNYDFFRGKSIDEDFLKPIESTTTSQDSEWSLEENSETYSQHETSFEKNNFTDHNNKILSRPQSINGCTSESPADTFTELDDFIGNSDSSSGDFHLWSSNIEFGSPPYKFNLCEEMDFDSIISAPNLNEALKKLDKHIQNKKEETTKHENIECDGYDMNIESSRYTILDKTMDDISLEISKYLESESKIIVDSAVSSDLTQKLWSVETLDSDLNMPSEFSVWETGIDDSENGNWSPIISSYRYPRVLPPQRSIMSLIDEEEERASSRAMNSPLSRMLSKSQDSFGSIKSYDKLQQCYSQSSEESKNECIGILEESDELNLDELNSIVNLDNTGDFIIHQNLVGNVDNTDCILSNIYESIGNVSIERRFADLKTSERINFQECELSYDLVTQKVSGEFNDFYDIKLDVEQNFNVDRLEGNYTNLTDVSKTITSEGLDSFLEFTDEIITPEREEIVNINTTQLHDGVDYHEENDNACEKYSTNDNDISTVVEKNEEEFYILGRLKDGSSKEINVENLEYQTNENREQDSSEGIFLRENYYENEIHTWEKNESNEFKYDEQMTTVKGSENKNLNNTIEDIVEKTDNIEKVLNDTDEDNKLESLNSVTLKDEILLTEEIGDKFSVNERKRYWDKKLEIMKTKNDLELSDKKRVDKIKPGNVSQLVSCFNDISLENTDTFFKKSEYNLQTTECKEFEKEREVSKQIEECGDIDVNNLKYSQEDNENKHMKCPKMFTDDSSLNTTKINYVALEESNLIFSEKDNLLSMEKTTIHREDENLEHTEQIENETIPPDLVKKWKNYWDEFITEQNENQTSKHLISNVTGIVSNVKHQFEFSKSIKQEETITINKLPSVKENIQIETQNVAIFKKTINTNDVQEINTRENDDVQEITTRESDDEIEEDSHYIDRNDLFLQKVKESHIETKNIVLERIKLFEKGNNTDLNENNKCGFSRNSNYNSYENHTDSTKWNNNMYDIDNEINTQEKLSDNNLLAKPIERVRSYSTGNIDIDVGVGKDDNNYKQNIVEEKEIEGKSAPKCNDDKIDCKIRFERAKQFFKVLEKTNVGERQDRCYHSMPRMDIALIRDSKLSIDSDSGTETRCQRKRDRIRGRRKKKKDIKVRSAPTSDTESCKRISDREDCNFGSERHKKLSERFHVKGLFRDISGDSDGFFRGIPHREAVLASLRSVDDVNVSPYEMDYRKLRPSKSVSSIPEGFQEEYPYLPTTPPSRYRPRSALEFHLIPRSVLLDLNI